MSYEFLYTPVASPTITTTYTVVNFNGSCYDTAMVTVTVNFTDGTIDGADAICAGDSTLLTASGGDIYLWSTESTGAAITVSPPGNSAYWVAVSTGLCPDTAKITVAVLPDPVIDAGENVTVNYGNSVLLSVTGNGAYGWTPPEGLSCTDCPSPTATPLVTTTYYATVTGANGCESLDSVTVFVNLPCGDAFVPSAFSPNNDGSNDVLYAGVRCAKEMEFNIYDRWGERIFRTEDSTNGWDGTYKGKTMNSAVFVYSLDAVLENGKLVKQKGNILLVR